jgi:protein-disulfide isomerase
MKNPWVVIGVIIVLLIAGSVWLSNSSAKENNSGVEVKAQIKGNPNGLSLTVYSDFQCPACAAYQPTIEKVMNDFGDQIRFEYKHLPLSIHPLAQSAAQAAEAAGQQGKFFEFHDLLFTNQNVWSKMTNPTITFNKYAEDLELDLEKFNRHIKSTLLRDKVRKDAREAIANQVTGTPTFFLNGVKVQVTSFEDFYTQIEHALNPEVEFSLPLQ